MTEELKHRTITILEDNVTELEMEIEQVLKPRLKEIEEIENKRGKCIEMILKAADALADEVAVMVQIGSLDARSRASDALLNYRNPPYSENSQKIAKHFVG
ncbi:hypothetical protein KAR91_22895 [Candidatus Pacearchaeota archaeon]|nr:hypothetical protein [Candidatus Pacearchaeota archaeon]